jgi:hypothetical protein
MMSTKFSALTPPCNRPYPPHEPHPISELRRGEVYPPQTGKPLPSRGREILVIAQNSPLLVPVLRSPARGGTEDGAGVRACPVLDTGGGEAIGHWQANTEMLHKVWGI